MKIQIKFSKDEAEGFKNFCKLKPPELDDDTFFKQIFFAGCNEMTQQIQSLVEAHRKAEEEKAEEAKNEQAEEQPTEE